MSASAIHNPPSDARLWLAALLVSVGINLSVIVVMALMAIHSLLFTVPAPEEQASSAENRIITIVPVIQAEEPPAPEKTPRQFARTSDDQPTGIPEDPKFIGERDTIATSDAAAVENSPDMPSQSGIKPRAEGEIETTSSDFQDGDLASEDPSGSPSEPVEAAVMQPPTEPVEPAPVKTEVVGETQPGAPREKLAEGPNPVDRPVPPEIAEEQPKSPPDVEPREEKQEVTEKVEEQPKPKNTDPARAPGFRGNQKKTELKGSISRQGRSALDVKSGPLGKYHAAISRAIEQSWQRQVIRNRDFITPGVIRIRVVLDENGNVRSVGTVEEFGVGTIQVGFTHVAIREADLPNMPADVKRELEGEPLELLYNFIF